jgi:hypothetical protein
MNTFYGKLYMGRWNEGFAVGGTLTSHVIVSIVKDGKDSMDSNGV